MNERLQNLLETSVEEYIRGAMPIASSALVEKMDVKLSSATIRNDLKTLEQMGYLKQVHTSGGRIPTTAGYRLYVDKMMSRMQLSRDEISIASENITSRTASLPQIIDELCKKLAETFNYSVIVKGRFDDLLVTDVRVIPLVEGKTMVLIGTKVGGITQTLDTKPLSLQEAMDASASLDTACRGMSLKQMLESLPQIATNLKSQLSFFCDLVRGLARELGRALDNNLTRNTNMIKLLDLPDYADIAKVKQLGRAIEDDETARAMLNSEGAIVIGAEHSNENLDNTGMVKFDYKIDGVSVASVGVIGPERMDYKNIITALHSILSEASGAAGVFGDRETSPAPDIGNNKFILGGDDG